MPTPAELLAIGDDKVHSVYDLKQAGVRWGPVVPSVQTAEKLRRIARLVDYDQG